MRRGPRPRQVPGPSNALDTRRQGANENERRGPVHWEQTIFGRPISHIGYAVKSIPQTVDLWSRAFGAGPFYTVDDVVFDEVTHRDGPAVFEHSSAFGQWGDITVELWEVRKLEPKAAFGPRLNPINQLNHVAYWVDDVEVDREAGTAWVSVCPGADDRARGLERTRARCTLAWACHRTRERQPGRPAVLCGDRGWRRRLGRRSRAPVG